MAAGSDDRYARDSIPGDARGGIRAEIQTFLTTRRARISPEQAGLPAYGEFFRDWDKAANDTVALLRAAAGRNAYDRRLSDLIGELSTRSDDFRRRWAAHDVQIHTTGIKLIHHPVVGDLDLPYESFPLSHHLTQSLLTYTAEPGSPSQDALTLLASWAASTTHRSNASEHENT